MAHAAASLAVEPGTVASLMLSKKPLPTGQQQPPVFVADQPGSFDIGAIESRLPLSTDPAFGVTTAPSEALFFFASASLYRRGLGPRRTQHPRALFASAQDLAGHARS